MTSGLSNRDVVVTDRPIPAFVRVVFATDSIEFSQAVTFFLPVRQTGTGILELGLAVKLRGCVKLRRAGLGFRKRQLVIDNSLHWDACQS